MRRMKKGLAVMVMVAMVLALGGNAAPVCAKKKASPTKVTVQKVTVENSLTDSKKELRVAKGKTVKLSTRVTVKPDKAKNRKVTFKSSNKKVAIVSAKGVVKGVKNGKTKITVTSKKNKKKKATIKVVVYKSAITKIKLSEESKVLNVGETVTLKPEISAKKGAYKKVKWVSSNLTVATVSAKGVVRAVSNGKAKITVASVDGSGKKASCNIKVENPINITSVSVANAQTVKFSLVNACTTLNTSNITIRKKEYGRGTYQYNCKIDSVTSADGINYTVLLDENEQLKRGDSIQVSIPAEYGTVTSMEAVFAGISCVFVKERVYTANTGSAKGINEVITTDSYPKCPINMTGGVLPTGCSMRMKGTDCVIEGIPTAAGVFKSQFSGIDDLGDTYTINVVFVVGSRTQIATYAEPKYNLTGEEVSTTLIASGGSGSYVYTIAGESYGMKIDEGIRGDSKLRGEIDAPGIYNVGYTVADAKNPSLCTSGTATFDIQQACVVSGTLTDIEGVAMSVDSRPPSIRFINKNRANRYGNIVTGMNQKSEINEGAYSVSVAPGTYDVIATYSYGDVKATQYLYDVSITNSRSGLNIKFPLYKVNIVSSNEAVVSDFKYWYNAKGGIVGKGKCIYLKEGSYTLSNGSFDWFSVTTTVTVPGSQNVVAAVKVPTNSMGVGTASYSTGNIAGGTPYLFIPEREGGYQITVDSNCLYEVYRKFDSKLEKLNVYLQNIVYLRANEMYYVVLYSSSPQSSVTLEEYHGPGYEDDGDDDYFFDDDYLEECYYHDECYDDYYDYGGYSEDDEYDIEDEYDY